ncbi:type I-B CRISPR-associated protein Cas5 [Arsenicibacter rosenii]|uniref:Type I-B CRISPR-associated protein Cas5 n=2 Tax=Arsenicibacter rosenii TaxID=1750698 RepID=A0A1S2VK71_9BACT|nr:type I-B CRISPR-associated protein Cas5 [Arsenicibacter rosenii]
MTLNFTEKEQQPVPESQPVSLRLISFDLRADFGFFRKPDVNDGLQLSYNMLHKPALLGILGAIAGLKGYAQKGQWPEYYKLLKDVPVGIEPLKPYHEKGNFTKTALTYTNTVGYANADGNLIVHENTLRRPAYRVYVLLNKADELQNRLLTRIRNQEAEFVPYLGKNEFTAWWENVAEYDVDQSMPQEKFELKTLFDKRKTIVTKSIDDGYDRFDLFDFSEPKGSYIYFERLPVSFDEQLFQYELIDFAYTDYPLKAPTQLGGLYRLNTSNEYVQLI